LPCPRARPVRAPIWASEPSISSTSCRDCSGFDSRRLDHDTLLNQPVTSAILAGRQPELRIHDTGPPRSSTFPKRSSNAGGPAWISEEWCGRCSWLEPRSCSPSSARPSSSMTSRTLASPSPRAARLRPAGSPRTSRPVFRGWSAGRRQGRAFRVDWHGDRSGRRSSFERRGESATHASRSQGPL
jgi:hypothetical protein